MTKPISIASLLRGVGEQLGVSLEQAPIPIRPEPSPAAIRSEVIAASGSPTEGRQTVITRPKVTLPVDPIFRDFATRFVRKVSDSLPQIMSSIDASDGTTLSGLAHWIKGTGGTVGLPGLTDIGRELQAMAKAEDYSGARVIVLELQAIIEKLLRESQCELAIR